MSNSRNGAGSVDQSQQDTLKKAAAQEAVSHVVEDEYIGIGTGSTVAYFIETLALSGKKIRGAVSTSSSTSALLKRYDINEISLNETLELAVYVDGADEVNHSLQMIKGGGGALLNEKIVASAARKFVCIADESKYVARLGAFPLPVEVIPSARSLVARQLLKMGGLPNLRVGVTTDNGNQIIDVAGFNLDQPLTMEETINRIVGVVDNGLFARQTAHVLLLAKTSGVETLYPH